MYAVHRQVRYNNAYSPATMTRIIGSIEDAKPVVFGNYRLTGKTLGKGAFGIVEEALHTQLKVPVSVKIINLLKCNSYVLKNLKREVDILRKLSHPHIVKLFEAIKCGNTHYMVTEIVNGGDLGSFVNQQRGKPLEERTTRRFSRQISEALEYMHKRGVVHRDLKLENIMLDSTKEYIKIVDFGLSNYWTPECALLTKCGSPEYSAPELFTAGVHYGTEVDMWAFGVIMYAMATGSLPFVYDSAINKSTKNREKFVERIYLGLTETQTRRITGYPAAFIHLLTGLMNPDKKLRLTVGEVANNSWVTNDNHWTAAAHDTLDVIDRERITRQVCGLLEITEDSLRVEVRTKPYGEVAGFYNIMMFMNSRTAEKGIVDPLVRITTNQNKDRVKKYKPQYYMNNQSGGKVWIVGTANKINDVTREKRPLQRSIYTCSTSSSSSGRSTDRTNYTPHTVLRPAARDLLTPPRPEPLKPTVVSSPLKCPIIKKSGIGTLASPSVKKDKKSSATSPFSLLPTRFKLSYPSCKTK